MFFRKKKGPPASTPKPADPPAPPISGDSATTQFLTGDANVDRRSVGVLLEAIAKVSESRDLGSLLDYIVDTSTEVTGADRGLLVFQDDAGNLSVRVARKRGAETISGEVKFSTTVVKKVIDEQEPVRTTVQSDSEAMELGMSVFDLKLRAVMCVPLVLGQAGASLGRGALYVDSKAATREFKHEDLSLFAALSQHVGIALLNAKLHEDSIEKVALEKSLEIASEIQSGLMPQIPKGLTGYEVHGWYRSADQTSGDFYDFVKTKGGLLAVLIGDVTGHGIGPALITATAQASLRSYLRVLDDPAAVASMLNQDLDERMDDGMFLTLFMSILTNDGSLRIINAGQTPPLVWRHATGTIETILGTDPALGMISDHEYTEGESVTLQSGDMLIAFTDGIVEARHPDDLDDLFGDDRLNAVFERTAKAGGSAQEVIEAIVEAALEFSAGTREDDMTIVAVKRT